MKRILARGSLVLAAAALASTGIALAPANAATVSQTCKKFTGTVTIKPGLSTTPGPQTATATGNLTGCTSAATTGGAGAIKATLKLPSNSSCQGLATGKQTVQIPTSTITWKNKKTSTMALTAKTGSGSTATQATITGKVSKGLFPGRPVTLTIKFTPKSGQDCTPGHPIKNLTIANTKPLVIH